MLKRKTVRQKCLVDARLYLDGEPAIECSIDDVTPEGARITAEKPIPRLVSKVLIFIPSISVVWAAHTRWRRGQSLGVEFIVGEADFIGTEKAPDPKLFALRMQCAQFSNTVKSMTATKRKTRDQLSAASGKVLSPAKPRLRRQEQALTPAGAQSREFEHV